MNITNIPKEGEPAQVEFFVNISALADESQSDVLRHITSFLPKPGSAFESGDGKYRQIDVLTVSAVNASSAKVTLRISPPLSDRIAQLRFA